MVKKSIKEIQEPPVYTTHRMCAFRFHMTHISFFQKRTRRKDDAENFWNYQDTTSSSAPPLQSRLFFTIHETFLVIGWNKCLMEQERVLSDYIKRLRVV